MLNAKSNVLVSMEQKQTLAELVPEGESKCLRGKINILFVSV